MEERRNKGVCFHLLEVVASTFFWLRVPAIAGTRISITFLICGASLLSTSVLAEIGADRWRSGDSLALLPGERKVIELHQRGADLALRLSVNGVVGSVIEGADGLYGLEVVAVTNSSASVLTVDTEVAAVFNPADVDYELRLRTANDHEFMLAAQLQQSSEKWAGGEKEESILLLELALEKAQRRAAYLPAIVNQLSSAYLSTSRYREALELELEYNELLQQEPVVFYHSKRRTGLALHLLGQLAEAHRTYEEVIRIQAGLVVGNNPLSASDKADSLGKLGIVEVLRGMRGGEDKWFDSGVRKLDDAIDLALQGTDYKLLGDLHNYAASALSMRNDRSFGYELLLLAESYFELADSSFSLVQVKNNLAYAQLGLGNVKKAQELYRESLALLEIESHLESEAHVRSRLALTYSMTGEYHRAESLLRKSVELQRQLGLEDRVIRNELERGIVLRLSGNVDEAVKLHESLLKSDKPAPAFDEVVQLHNELGQSSRLLGNSDAWHYHAEQAWMLQSRAARVEVRLGAHLISAEAAFENSDFMLAESVALAGLNILRDSQQEPLQQLQLLELLGRVQLAQSNLQAGLHYLQRGYALFRSVGQQLGSRHQLARWGDVGSSVVNGLVSSRIDQYISTKSPVLLDELFEMMQSSRGWAFRRARQRVNDRATAVSLGAVLPNSDVLLKKKRLLHQYVLQRSTVASADDYYAADERQRVSEVNPSDQPNPNYAGAVVSLEDIQGQLAQGQMALALHFADPASFALVVSNEGVETRQISGRKEFETALQSFNASMREPGSQHRVSMERLNTLFEPILLLTKGANSLVLEDAGLASLLQVGALRDPYGVEDEPVFKRVEVQHSPSLSLYFNQDSPSRGEAPNQGVDVVVVADPKFSPLQPQGLVTIADATAELPRLPHTGREAAEIEKLLVNDSVQVYLGEHATVDAVTNTNARSARILHIATHGFASLDNLLLKGLALSQGSKKSDLAFDVLTEEDIRRNRFFSDLVVVSGCDTGVGQRLEGEGMMSLARTFLEQGAKSVVSTRWPVSDRATAEFMREFYAALGKSFSVPRALVAAQAALRDSRRFSHPRHWAGFVLSVATPPN